MLLVGSLDPFKPVHDMTYNVFGGMLNLTHPSKNHLLNNRRLVSGRMVSKMSLITESGTKTNNYLEKTSLVIKDLVYEAKAKDKTFIRCPPGSSRTTRLV